MQGLTRSSSLPLQSGFTLCPLGRFTGLLGPALFLLGPALFVFGRFAHVPATQGGAWSAMQVKRVLERA